MSGKVACVKVLVEAGANKEAIGKSNVKPSLWMVAVMFMRWV